LQFALKQHSHKKEDKMQLLETFGSIIKGTLLQKMVLVISKVQTAGGNMGGVGVSHLGVNNQPKVHSSSAQSDVPKPYIFGNARNTLLRRRICRSSTLSRWRASCPTLRRVLVSIGRVF
jgi:hypothetical protein